MNESNLDLIEENCLKLKKYLITAKNKNYYDLLLIMLCNTSLTLATKLKEIRKIINDK